MRASYFPDTDTLFIRFNEERIVETTDLGGLDLVDFDARGNLVALTIENAVERKIFPDLTVEEVTAAMVAAERASTTAADQQTGQSVREIAPLQ